MAITLTYSGTTLALSDRLAWTDEFGWSPVEQSTEYSTTGALLVHVATKLAGRPITLNATGAVAALLGEIGVPTNVMRGFAVISRAAGLVAHIVEEQNSPSGRFIWDTVEHAIPYVGEGGKP